MKSRCAKKDKEDVAENARLSHRSEQDDRERRDLSPDHNMKLFEKYKKEILEHIELFDVKTKT